MLPTTSIYLRRVQKTNGVHIDCTCPPIKSKWMSSSPLMLDLQQVRRMCSTGYDTVTLKELQHNFGNRNRL